MNRLELLKLIANAPKNLKGYSELLDYARNFYKQVMGVFPEGIDNISIKQAVKDIANQRDPKKVVPFPKGGKDKTDFFTTRPDPRVKQPPGAEMDVIRANENLAGGANYAKGDTKYNADVLADEIARMRGTNREDLPVKESMKLYSEAYDYLTELNKLNRPSPGKGELSVTIGGETKNMTPEGIMKTLMGGKTKKGELFNISGQKGKFLTEDEFARELESDTANFIQNSPGFNLQLIPDLKKPGAKAYNPFPDKQGDKFLTDDQRQRVLSRLERIMKNEEYQTRFADNFADLMEEGDDVIEFAPDLFKIDPPKKADGGRISFDKGGEAGFAGDPMEGDKFAMPQPDNRPMEVPPNLGFQPIMAMPQKGIPGSGGIKELRQFLQAVGAPELGMGYNFPVGQSGILSVGAAPSGNVSAQFKMPLSGGRFGFKDGSKPKDPSKRSFLKLMGGLAAIPFIGKYFKPAAKVVEKAAPVVQEGAKLGYENFMLLVDKIKRLGKSADNLATQERQKVTTYKGKDGSEYELVEDLSTGDISVTKDKPGIAVANRGTDDAEAIDVIEDRSTFIYKKGEDVVDTKTGTSKRTPDEYDEVKQTSGDGEGFDGIDEIDDRAVNEVINELTDVAPVDDLTANQYMGTKNLRSKKAGGGLAYMLGE